MRIASLAPSATAILCEIGAKGFLIGVTKWCSDVAPVVELPKLGDCWRLDSLEKLLKLRPSLVIGSVPFKTEIVAKILEQSLNFLAVNPRTLRDIQRDIRLLGGITGRQSEADRLVQKMMREFAGIARQSGGAKRKVRVYCEAWPNPRISSPPWVAELVKICGGAVVVPPGKKVTDEEVARGQPDVIVLAWTATGANSKPEACYKISAWKDLPAIRNRQVFAIRDELLNTPGPPLIWGAKELFKILQTARSKRGTQ